jgi:hypothetical protein
MNVTCVCAVSWRIAYSERSLEAATRGFTSCLHAERFYGGLYCRNTCLLSRALSASFTIHVQFDCVSRTILDHDCALAWRRRRRIHCSHALERYNHILVYSSVRRSLPAGQLLDSLLANIVFFGSRQLYILKFFIFLEFKTITRPVYIKSLDIFFFVNLTLNLSFSLLLYFFF